MFFRLILNNPRATLLLVTVLVVVSGLYAQRFNLDASADSLVLENDESLNYYRSIQGRYATDETLIITYTPDADLFERTTLLDLQRLQRQLEAIDGVAAVTSILTVPLINSPPLSLVDLRHTTPPTLLAPRTDIRLAREEFLSSPLYRNLLVSPNGDTTALQLSLQRDPEYQQLLQRRSELRELRLQQSLTPEQQQELTTVSQQFRQYNTRLQAEQRALITAVRKVMAEHQPQAQLFLGGVPMIVADSIEFVRHDITTFGVGVILFIVLILALAFRRPRWILLPLVTCLAAVVITTGFLGLMEWPVTVVSSNFISLLLIITLSLTIHLIVRYRELHAADPILSPQQLVEATLRSKARPCFYTAITTIVAFGSLIVSGIRPVIDFGIMMAIGTAIALILSFTLFPAALVLLKPQRAIQRRDLTAAITGAVGRLIEAQRTPVLVLFGLLVVVTLYGISRLTVENSFINYYKPETEIYQGMTLIDRKLGGTTPLEVIIDAPATFLQPPPTPVEPKDSEPQEEGLLPFMDDLPGLDDVIDMGMELLPGERTAPANDLTESYWFNTYMLRDAARIHHYLDRLPETGKVLSIATTMEMLQDLNDGDPVSDFMLSMIHRNLPESIQQAFLDPYLSTDGNQLRFTLRVRDSDPELRRNALIEKIRNDLGTHYDLKPEQIHVTGMLVLYNNMLQSLFQSQILTLGAVFLAILVMFIVLFRNLRMALLTLIPNIIAATSILGLMGATATPLDLMTITIAAIAIGIAVDNAIHYVYRFTTEFQHDHSYWGAIHRSHRSIGMAMYYTTLTITIGFSILAFSNFIPTIYFGLLTGLSMVVALLANLMLLPLLLVLVKPLGPDHGG